MRQRIHEELDKLLDQDIHGVTLSAVGLRENGEVFKVSIVDGRFTGKEIVALLFAGVEEALKMTDIPETKTAANAIREILTTLMTVFDLGYAIRKASSDTPTENVTWH